MANKHTSSLRIPSDRISYGRYPETSFYDWVPMLEGLTPPPEVEIHYRDYKPIEKSPPSSPGTEVAVLPGPFEIDNLDLLRRPLPETFVETELTSYEPPPPLTELENVGLTVKEHLKTKNNSLTNIFHVEVGSESMILKTVSTHCLETSKGILWLTCFPVHRQFFSDFEDIDSGEFKPVSSQMLEFYSERDAYEHLQHYGTYRDGSVPECYGWFTLSHDDRKQINKVSGLWLAYTYLEDTRPVFGILLQYFPRAKELSEENATFAVTEKALRSLCRIHQAYVIHNDIARRNCLIKENGDPVWIDFDHATTPRPTMQHKDRPPACRGQFWVEFIDTFGFIYGVLVGFSLGYISFWSLTYPYLCSCLGGVMDTHTVSVHVGDV